MSDKTYIKKNLSLLRYLLGIWLLGSVGWMPFHQGESTYYLITQIAWIWFFGGLILAIITFVFGTFVAGFVSLAPYKSWSFDKKFLRFFLISCLIILPFLSMMMIEFPPEKMLSMIKPEEVSTP